MPRIYDLYTTSTGSSIRKNVFAPGESIQWNILHTADDDEVGRPYEVRYHVEHMGLTRAHAGDTFEVLWPIKFTARGTFAYETRGRWNGWWFDSIPDVGGSLDIPAGWNRADLVNALGDAQFNLLFVRGYWRFTAIVEMTEAATGRAFDVMAGWTYRILD